MSEIREEKNKFNDACKLQIREKSIFNHFLASSDTENESSKAADKERSTTKTSSGRKKKKQHRSDALKNSARQF
jgi:hypothetical protein